MDKCIITISRQYGSGGRHVGELIAKELDIPFYDKEIIHMSAEKSGMSPGYIEKSGESIPNAFLHNLVHAAYTNIDSVSYYDMPVSDKLFQTQSTVIKELAAQGSCVIVGRCADYILRDNPALVKVFLRAETEDRVHHAIDHYDLPAEKATEHLKKIDRHRENYYKYYTTRQWGSINNFDIVLNTSFTGVEGAATVIKAMIKSRGVL